MYQGSSENDANITFEIILFVTQVESIELKYSDSAEATEKIREECCPGIPYIVFSVHPSMSLTLINPQPQSGHFTHIINVRDGDNVAKLTSQLTRTDRLRKGKKA
jgi:leucyl-tRNA synthetase